jgi:hypothetical protein
MVSEAEEVGAEELFIETGSENQAIWQLNLTGRWALARNGSRTFTHQHIRDSNLRRLEDGDARANGRTATRKITK